MEKNREGEEMEKEGGWRDGKEEAGWIDGGRRRRVDRLRKKQGGDMKEGEWRMNRWRKEERKSRKVEQWLTAIDGDGWSGGKKKVK